MRRTVLSLVLASLSGCSGQLVVIDPNTGQPLTHTDMAGGTRAAHGADGGAAHFTDVQADLDALGCSASSCHGGPLPLKVVANPATPADVTANYQSFMMFASSGATSQVLTKSLSGSGVSHAGGSFFQSTSDPIYQSWLAWINAGGPQ